MDVSVSTAVRLPRAIGAAMALLAALALAVGWGLGIEALVRFRADAPAMMPSTAVCFLIASLPLLMRHRDGAAARRFAGLLAILPTVSLLSGDRLGDFGLDGILPFSFAVGDRMAAGTAAGFLLAAFLLGVRRADAGGLWHLGGAFLGLSTAVMVGLSVAWSAFHLTIPGFTSMSALTSLCFLGLYAAILAEAVMARDVGQA